MNLSESKVKSKLILTKDLNFKISINDPINFSKEDSIENITLKLNQILETMILKKPEQWIWSHNRWK